jgi:hypothetical protein
MGSTKGTSGPCSGRNPATRDALWRPAARLTATPPPKPPLERITELTFVKSCQVSSRASPCHTEGHSHHRMDTNRLAKELREIQSDTKSGVTVEVLGDNLAHMQGTLKGASPSVHLPPFRPSRGTAVRIRATQIRPFARPPSGPHPGPTRSRPPSISPPIHRTIHPPQDPRNPRTRAASST